jgi:hypothetical protein
MKINTIPFYFSTQKHLIGDGDGLLRLLSKENIPGRQKSSFLNANSIH